jgi:phage shock protein PspC (stress-responsive transcriptional regulator)
MLAFVWGSLYVSRDQYAECDCSLTAWSQTGMYSVAGACAGLLAYGLLKIDSAHIRGWQVVFLFEGGVTVLLGILTFFILPKTISSAWFLSSEERAHAIRRMELDVTGTLEEGDNRDTSITKRDVLDVVKDWKKLFTVICNITTVLPVTAFTTFLPLIVQGMGYKGIKATLMSVPPFVVYVTRFAELVEADIRANSGTAGLLIIVYSSDHLRERSLHTIGGLFLGIVGCIVMAVSTDTHLRYGFTHVCLAGVFVGGPLLAVWLAGNTPGKGARSVILGINGCSNIAGVIAGQVFKAKYRPRCEGPYPVVWARVRLTPW